MTRSAVIFSVLVGSFSAVAVAVPDDPPPSFRVAFFGDSKITSNEPDLFKMLREEEVAMIVHAGDLSYSPNQNLIFDTVEGVMGPNFPFVAALGNHDLDGNARSKWYNGKWVSGYQELLRNQATRAEVPCYEDPVGGAGVMQTCYYNGMVVVNLAYKLLVDWRKSFNGKDYAQFINQAFSAHPNARWRICNFHKPVRNNKDPVVETCMRWGAIIANGHKHSYTRTHYLGFSPYNADDSDTYFPRYELSPGWSIQWVSGLGGETPEVVKKHYDDTAVAWPQSDPTVAVSGAVICEFNPLGQAPDQAVCVFRDVLGRKIDEFYLKSLPPTEW